MRKNLRAYQKQVGRASLTWCQGVKHVHPNFEQGIICTDAHIHQRNESKNLVKAELINLQCSAVRYRKRRNKHGQ